VTRRQGPGPEATLGPLDTPPFYAVQVYSGVLGTKGGPRTDGNGQVLDVDGRPIRVCTPPETPWPRSWV